MNISHRILVIRNDKLGDFMLAWPALKTLREASPENHISVLVPEYTADIARICPWVDEVVIDPGKGHKKKLFKNLNEARFDVVLTLYSTGRIGKAVFRAGIPLRIAPATKWAQIFYNVRISQRRSRSEKPEYIYNQEMAEYLTTRLNQFHASAKPPYWPLPDDTRNKQIQRLAKETGLDTRKTWWFFHPGSGGSAVNLSAERYIKLIQKITTCHPPSLTKHIQWIVTWGPGEEENARHIQKTLKQEGIDAYLMPPRPELDEFALTLSAGSGMIAGSTGPLHIAGCLNLATIGFYPSKRSATALRWQTCNTPSKRLAFSPPAQSSCKPAKAISNEMALIDLDDAAPQCIDHINRN